MKKLPIGIQNFEGIVEEGYYYIDKTEILYQLINTGKIFFISRPRRFGKSLLCSTLGQSGKDERNFSPDFILKSQTGSGKNIL